LQLRQAELESSQSHAESLQSQNTELQYQLRESKNLLALLNEELAEARRDQESKMRENATSVQDVARLLSAAEAKHEARIAEFKTNLSIMERERNDGEAEWSRKLREKTRELENVKTLVESTSKTGLQNEEVVTELKEEVERLGAEIQLRLKEIAALQSQIEQGKDAEVRIFAK
jgi:chromosome segregation ATPase